MTSTPLITTPLPTAWLVPPPGLLHPPSHTDIEPISLTISCIFGSIAILTITLLFFKKNKGNYVDDTAVDDFPVPVPVLPPHPQPHFSPPQPRRTNAHPDPSSSHSSTPYPPHTKPKPNPTLSHPSALSPPVPPYTHANHPTPNITLTNPNANANANANTSTSTLNSEALYAEYQRTGVMPTNNSTNDDVRNSSHNNEWENEEYAASLSFVASEFVPLEPEEVGLHGRVWRAGDGGGEL
ncbi:hypothetical protein NX059_005743 [Plenodomus lindquistii]|nr:hypothetical protein NX059_005743 [Plenodomus lindquistii]